MKKIWLIWIVAMLALGGYFGYRLLVNDADKTIFLIGEATDGHHQIEMACGSCHTSPFGGGELLQKACVNCHGEELRLAHDSHPQSKFTDPRNADRLQHLEARYCVTCHREHHRERTRAMGVTQPDDVCFHCHKDIASERPSHAGMAFATCASSGCHNYHDNRALYEDFLLKFGDEPAFKTAAAMPSRAAFAQKHPHLEASAPLPIDAADAGVAHLHGDAATDWAASAHANAGVNCSGCHRPAQRDARNGNTPPGDEWIEKPGVAVCQGCHAAEAETFFAGKHGMRLNPELSITLSPMTPAQGRLPFKREAAHKELTCNSCHGAHRFDTRQAAAQSCIGCHDDEHSRNFENSPHAQLWRDELRGAGAPGSGVACATCHMPRLETELDGGSRMLVNHNQNDNLRPREKMIRSVCQNCHGLAFSIDSLADDELIRSNFSGRPAQHIRSIDMARERTAER